MIITGNAKWRDALPPKYRELYDGIWRSGGRWTMGEVRPMVEQQMAVDERRAARAAARTSVARTAERAPGRTDTERDLIVTLFGRGVSVRRLSRRYGISEDAICGIIVNHRAARPVWIRRREPEAEAESANPARANLVRRDAMDAIIDVVASHYGVQRDALTGSNQTSDVVRPRQMAMYLAREIASLKWCEIGRGLGRAHDTVTYGHECVARRQPPELAALKDAVRAALDIRREARKSDLCAA